MLSGDVAKDTFHQQQGTPGTPHRAHWGDTGIVSGGTDTLGINYKSPRKIILIFDF